MPAAEITTGTRYRPLRRVEYDKLIALGEFQDEKIELLDGLLVPMSPIGPPHNWAVQVLTEILLPALIGKARVHIQGPFAALEISEPEPDLAVVPVGKYNRNHPDQAFLIIEVAESSLAKDRGLKQRLYASCGVPEYWIVNLVESQIEVYTDPTGDGYSNVQYFRHGDSIRLLRFPEVEVRVEDVIS